MDKIEIAERYILLLLGVENKPIPSKIHLQKELFILSESKPILKDIFNFEKHYFGPFSRLLDEISESPLFYEKCFEMKDDKYFLTDKGKEEFKKLFQEYKDDPEFNILYNELKILRNIYDKLSEEELLFLIYLTYPEYTEYSNVSDELIKNRAKRKSIADKLLSKGVITDKRYNEILEGLQND